MPNTPISPKIKAGLNWGVIATLAVTILSTITPDMLAGLGVYAPLVYGAIGTGSAALAGYLKADPLRNAPADTTPADKPAGTPTAPTVYPAAAVATAEAAPVEVTPIIPAQ